MSIDNVPVNEPVLDGNEERYLLELSAWMHDVGKIGVPDSILTKPTSLTEDEFAIVKLHPVKGGEIVGEIVELTRVADVIRHHHERMDGSGYPQGLKGAAILLEARIMAVADVVEAMSSHRPYRPGLGIESTLSEIERGRGSIYDAEVAGACLRLFREKRYQLPA